ncbi:MAG: deoxyribonuclease IV [Dehalococcoidia bacterium]
MRRFGAHVGGGLARIPARAQAIGAECVQIFASAPQDWRPPAHDPAVVAAFRDGLEAHAIAPVLLHGIYLLNPASTDAVLVARSVEAIVADLVWADRLGAAAVVIHLGSAGREPLEPALERCADALLSALSRYDGPASLLLETCAGQGATVGRRFEDLGYLLDRLDERAGVCFDTCHVFAAGYDISAENGLAATIEDLDHAVGLARVQALHVNDSKRALGSNLDRHENLGDGLIGEIGFRRLLHHPAFATQPLILEVPGLAGDGPDRENLNRLRRWAGAPPLSDPGDAEGRLPPAPVDRLTGRE